MGNNIDALNSPNSFASLRIRAHFTRQALAKEAGVSADTVTRMERGIGVTALKAYLVLEVLNRKLGTNLQVSEVEGLVVIGL